MGSRAFGGAFGAYTYAIFVFTGLVIPVQDSLKRAMQPTSHALSGFLFFMA